MKKTKLSLLALAVAMLMGCDKPVELSDSQAAFVKRCMDHAREGGAHPDCMSVTLEMEKAYPAYLERKARERDALRAEVAAVRAELESGKQASK